MKNNMLSQVLTEIINFTNKHNIKVKVNIFERSELDGGFEEQSTNWSKFEKFAGTYCFINNEENSVKYIGMSLSNTGGRIYQWLFNERKIVDCINSNDTVLIISFDDEQYYMAPALESYLINNYNPELNRQR